MFSYASVDCHSVYPRVFFSSARRIGEEEVRQEHGKNKR